MVECVHKSSLQNTRVLQSEVMYLLQRLLIKSQQIRTRNFILDFVFLLLANETLNITLVILLHSVFSYRLQLRTSRRSQIDAHERWCDLRCPSWRRFQPPRLNLHQENCHGKCSNLITNLKRVKKYRQVFVGT